MTERAPRVLITFASRGGVRERWALECGVGAVQARGVIRLRRISGVKEVSPSDEIPRVLKRMRLEYVSPTGADVDWADGLVFCGPGSVEPEWEAYLELVGACGQTVALDGKVGVIIAREVVPPGALSFGAWSARLTDLGLHVVPTPDNRESDIDPCAIGRRTVEAIRGLKPGTAPRL